MSECKLWPWAMELTTYTSLTFYCHYQTHMIIQGHTRVLEQPCLPHQINCTVNVAALGIGTCKVVLHQDPFHKEDYHTKHIFHLVDTVLTYPIGCQLVRYSVQTENIHRLRLVANNVQTNKTQISHLFPYLAHTQLMMYEFTCTRLKNQPSATVMQHNAMQRRTHVQLLYYSIGCATISPG